MEVRAVAKWVRIGPRKVRRFVDLVRGKGINEARAILGVQSSPAAGHLRKTLESAVANAENNHDMKAEDLLISKAYVDMGFDMPRMLPRARGRADQFKRLSCHITVVVSDGESDE